MQTKLIVVDLETTGLTAGVHEIVEIACLMVSIKRDCKGMLFDIIDEYHTLVKPFRPELVEEEAFELNNLSLEKLEKAPTPMEVRLDFDAWLELHDFPFFEVIGHNYGGFDKEFFKLFLGNDYKGTFDYHAHDTWAIARAYQLIGWLPQDLKISLEGLSENLGLSSFAHTARSDVLDIIKVYQWLLNIALEKEASPIYQEII